MKLLAVVSSLASSGARRVLLPLFLGFVVLCPACVTAPPSMPVPSPAPAEPLLEEGRPVERTLAGGERQEHRIAVEAGWYVRVEVEQIGVDVVASLLGPDGTTLFSTDDPDGLQDKEILALIAPATGELRLVLASRDLRTALGTYRVELTARRPAEPGDAERAAAQKAMSEAWHRAGSQEEREKREAIGSYQEAIRLWRAAGETRWTIAALNELGGLQSKLSETQAALGSFESALSLSLEVGYPEGEAFAHSNLAVGALALKDTDRLAHYERALVLFRELGNLREQSRVLSGMGILYRDRGNFDEALRYLSEALPLRRAAKDARGELNTLLALALVYQGRGEKEQATEHLDRALELSRSLGEDEGASVLSTLAFFQRFRGELGDALARLQQVCEVNRRKGNQGLEARALDQLGSLYLDLGDLDKAQSSFEQGLQLVSGKSPEGEARFLNNLGWLLYLRGSSQAALEKFEKAARISREKNLPAGIAQALGYTGAVYVATGRPREGLELLQEELALRRKNSDRLGEAASLVKIGGAWQALGDFEQAEMSFRAALDLGRRVGNTGLQATCLYLWAVLDRQRGDLRQALDRVEEALRIIESLRSRVSSDKLRTIYLASKRSWYELYIDLQMRLEEEEPGQGRAAAALEASERARARGLLDLIAEGRIDVQEGIAADLKKQETELGVRLSWIQEKLGDALNRDPESDRAAELRLQLDQVGEKMELLEEEIRRLHPRYAEVRYPTPLRLEQIADLLDEDTALLEYFVGREASFLFMVTRDGLSTYRLPPAGELEERVQAFRKTLERPGILTLGRFRIEAGDLYDVVLGPAAARLAGTPNLLISPDGPLSLIPFEALLTERAAGSAYKHLSYLLRDYAISYVPSASVLAGLRETRPDLPAGAPPPKELVAFGDPILPEAQLDSMPLRTSQSPWTAPVLPGSGREINAIASLYPSSAVELYMRESATEVNVKANPQLQTARRIHFATHGFLDEVRPQLSGLMLTRDPESGEDGLLQVYEIFNLRMNADLVVLSACETGLGEQVTGEGMIGLTRGFIYAGARSLLVSLWPVSDLSTPDLMTAFYRHLGDTKTAALRQAKLERIEAGDEPYRWAPFILAGDPH